jgi:hypothetical protein
MGQWNLKIQLCLALRMGRDAGDGPAGGWAALVCLLAAEQALGDEYL